MLNKEFERLKEDMLNNVGDATASFNVLGNDINTPVKYPDATARMVFFPISFEKAEKLISNNRLIPVRFLGKRAVLGITIFDYVESDVGAYRELALSIPVLKDPKFRCPFLPLIFDGLFKNFGFYTVLLAMNNDIGRIHSKKIFGYPTYSKNINVDINKNEKTLFISVKEGKEKIIDLKINNSKKAKLIRKSYNTYIKKDNNLNLVKMDIIAMMSESFLGKNIEISLGNHYISKILKDLDLGDKAIGISHYTKLVEVLSKSTNA